MRDRLQNRLEAGREKQQDGFTLIELLIVIVILGILAGIVVFAVGGINDRGDESACDAELKTTEVAVEAFRAKNGNYPADLTALTVAPNVFLREVPDTVTYTAATGAVTATC